MLESNNHSQTAFIDVYTYCNLLQDMVAQPGEDVLFSVVCKDFFDNSRTCLLSVSEANQNGEVHMAKRQKVSAAIRHHS